MSGLRGQAPALWELWEWLKGSGGRCHWNWGRGGERPECCMTSVWAWQTQGGGKAWGTDEGVSRAAWATGRRQQGYLGLSPQVSGPVVYKTIFPKLFFKFPVTCCN